MVHMVIWLIHSKGEILTQWEKYFVKSDQLFRLFCKKYNIGFTFIVENVIQWEKYFVKSDQLFRLFCKKYNIGFTFIVENVIQVQVF